MVMPDQNLSDTDNACREIANAFQGILIWKWDDRFEAVLAEFGLAQKESITAILECNLSFVWDRSNINKAPDSVTTIIDSFGGLMSGQLFFTTDPNQDALIFGAWWPWGDGETISIRIGSFDERLSAAEQTERIKQFKDWFGI